MRIIHFTIIPTALMLVTADMSLAQRADTKPDPGLDSLVGLYRVATGAFVIVWRPAAGQVAAGFEGGEVRVLASASGTFTYGPSFGATTPVRGALRRASKNADTLTWTPADSDTRVLVRVPLRETNVGWANARTRLAGTVIIPEGPGPFPGVVMLHGSGVETRESSRVMAYYLAAHGVASLIYDKRSTGASSGDSFNVPFADLARDALGGVDLLRRTSGVRREQIGLFGPSQGSWIALAATQIDPAIAFLILQSGDATSPLEQEMYRIPSILRGERARGVPRSAKLTDTDLADLERFRRLKFLHAMTGSKPTGWDDAVAAARAATWFSLTGELLPPRDFWAPSGAYDPMPALRAYRGPVLAVFGGRDITKDVPLNATLMRDVLARSGNPHSAVHVIDDANHGLFETKTGLLLEVELPRLTRIAPGYLETITSFLTAIGKPIQSPRNDSMGSTRDARRAGR